MAKTKKRSSQVKDEDIVIYKIMAAMVIVAAVICVLIVLYNKYPVMSHFMAIYNTVYYTAIGGAIGAAVCYVAALLFRKQKTARKVLLILATCLLIVAVCSVVMRIHTWEGIIWLFIAFPAGLVLYIFYLIYQPEFFFLSLLSAVSGIGDFVLYQIGTTMLRPWVATLLAVFLVGSTVLIALTGKEGILSMFGLRIQLFREPRSKILLLVTAALCILGWILTVLVGGVAALVSAGVALLWLIIMACYFTIKLV